MKAIILCAGKGERMRPLTNTIPKPMISIANKPVLEYLILLCKKHGITEIAINLSYLPDVIKNYFGDGKKFGVKIHYVYEKELLGTAGALNNFKDFFRETFFVIYSDNITDVNLSRMLAYHKKKGGMGTIFVYKEDMIDQGTTPGYMVVDKDMRIEKIAPFPKIHLNSGFYILEPKIFDYIPQGYSDFGKDVFPAIFKKEHFYAFTDDCYIKEVGQMMRYEKAKEDIESGKVRLRI